MTGEEKVEKKERYRGYMLILQKEKGIEKENRMKREREDGKSEK